MNTRIRLTVFACIAALAMLATTAAYAGPLKPGTYYVDCRGLGNPVGVYDYEGKFVAWVWNWPCPGSVVTKIIITSTPLILTPPVYSPSNPGQWGGNTPQQIADLLKLCIVPAVLAPAIDINQIGPPETLPWFQGSEADVN